MVSDSTGETCFILFDSLAFKFFHKTAMEMLNELEQDIASMSGENDLSAFKSPDSTTKRKTRSVTETQDDTAGLSQIPTPQFSTTKATGKMKQKKQDQTW
ncbi:hypothetical protein RIF29_00502 [Crotalaria pallida]|uniref:Replication factor A C-terminal domain-containing protein n=1 Tax=Crotalaria pallida TaxID=3830 RepID=A0AAN9IXJ7_CROPI